MEWFEMSVKAPDDAKFQNLSARLKNPLAFAYVVRIYAHCYLHETDRFSGPGAVSAIETAAGWRGKTGRLVACLLEADVSVLERGEPETLVVHGVAKRLEAAMKRRSDAAARKEKWRKEHAQGTPDEPAGNASGTRSGTGTGREGTGYQTRPDQIGPIKEQKQLPCSEASSLPSKAGFELFPQHPPQRTTANGAGTASGQPGKGRPASKPTDPRQAEKRAAFESLFLEIRGEPYYWQGAKDYGAVNRLIAVHLDEWERRARVGLTATDFQRRVSTVAELGMRWNALAGTGPLNGAMRALAAAEPHESFTSRKVILPP